MLFLCHNRLALTPTTYTQISTSTILFGFSLNMSPLGAIFAQCGQIRCKIGFQRYGTRSHAQKFSIRISNSHFEICAIARRFYVITLSGILSDIAKWKLVCALRSR